MKKEILMLFYNSICKSYINIFGKHDKRKMKYQVSLCLIFKNEAPFLKEWLDYHLTIGVSHFYLYNNNSDDNYLDVIKPYIMIIIEVKPTGFHFWMLTSFLFPNMLILSENG